MQQGSKYDYTTAGFNGFLSRALNANPFAQTLSDNPTNSSGTELNFDQQPVSGSLGNILQIGTIHIDGTTGRISVFDNNGNEVGRIGDLGD